MHTDLLALREALEGDRPRFATLQVRGDTAQVAPSVDPDRLFVHLSQRFGTAWNLAWAVESASPPIVRCRLELLEATREGVATAHDFASARDLALTDAARAWQILPDAWLAEPVWVDYDPEEGANTAELHDETERPEPARPGLPPEPPRDPQMEKARAHIDTLMDQLRERGLGKQASLVLVKYGGYGETLDASRKIYAELKALLKG